MPTLTPIPSDATQAIDDLACYLQTSPAAVYIPILSNTNLAHHIQYYSYNLPLGELKLLNIILDLPKESTKLAIDNARRAAIKAAVTWQRRYLLENKAAAYFVLTLDIRLQKHSSTIDNVNNVSNRADNNNSSTIVPKGNEVTLQRLTHDFGARYFMEELITDVSETEHILQLFSQEDWQFIIATLQTPCEIWRFLRFHLAQIQRSFMTGMPNFDSERHLLEQFMSSSELFTQALLVDKVLIEHTMQDKTNAALMTMSLAQKNSNLTAPMYQQHMQQAAVLWSQLSLQMIELKYHNQESDLSAKQWQQQLLDESLFSRHELVRTIYKHPKQSAAMIEKGYVVHQHSYESLGRHYVLIFYGQDAQHQQSRAVIQPNLATIAQDVATRLPLVELHHIIVLGIEFVSTEQETFIDIDLWVQPITAMTLKERQLTKKLQHLNQKNKNQRNKNQPATEHNQSAKLPSLKLNLIAPMRSNKY